jgi:hypothetical protein
MKITATSGFNFPNYIIIFIYINDTEEKLKPEVAVIFI